MVRYQAADAEAVAELIEILSPIELRIAAEGRDRELLERLVEIADRGCIMMNTLRGKLDVRVLIGAAI